MNHTPFGYNGDDTTDTERDAAQMKPLTETAQAELIAYDIELARLAMTQAAPPMTW